ncbi:MAG TPA: cyclic nucleotide-binding domain-containing protein [Acidimicrobiales bacterium]|nr:cyclic nucleotide-binding domain-containing protein [Acidimicrobiales bacterium]
MRNKPSRDWLDVLRHVALFSGLNNRELARVGRLITPVDLAAGEALTTEGASGRQAFIVISGHAEVTIAGRLVAIVGPGEIVGEMALLDHRPRTATVTAVESMRAFVVDPGSFTSLLAEPGIARTVLDAEVSRLRSANESQTALASA